MIMADEEHSILYARHVNEKWVKLLDVLGMNRRYRRCIGSRLETVDGEMITDFLSGYCVYNTGHNHPRIVRALVDELQKNGPAMLQSYVPELAGELAGRLLKLSGGRLARVFFTSSGSEGVETAIKFARCFTRRDGILHCDGAFHGLTCGALSLMGNPWWREGFGPMLADVEGIPFIDLDALEEKLKTRRFAAFIVEPVQAESGVCVPGPGVLKQAEEICRRHRTLFVLDEVQTGLCRTGPFLAAHHFGVEPDMVILAKALSGGLVPVGALLMTEEINRSVYSSLERAFIHASTFGENLLSMCAGMATLDVIEEEKLGQRARDLGEILRGKLRVLADRYEMVEEVRGLGLMNGVKFRAPSSMKLRLLYESFRHIHAGLFGQMVVMKLFREGGILTQMGGNNYMVIKSSPPLTSSEADLDAYVSAFDRVMESFHRGSGFAEGLRVAQRALVL